MRGNKKVPQQNKGPVKSSPSTINAPPSFKGRQPVKIKYGVVDETEHPATATPQGFRKADAGTASRPTKMTNSPTVNLKSKASPTGTTKSNVPLNKTSVQSSACSPKQQQQRPHQQPLQKKGECEVCRQQCRSHCAGCKRVFYCSKQHQQADWSKHKLICRPFSIPTQYSSGFHLRPPVTSSSSSFNSGTANNSAGTAASSSVSPELQFMISTKQIAGGNVLFFEKPLLVTANMFELPSNQEVWCCSCLKLTPNPCDSLNNNDKRNAGKSVCCPSCQVPLCFDCHKHLGNTDAADFSKKFNGGQGHSLEECALICDICQKSPQLLGYVSGNSADCTVDFMKDLCILRVLMFRTTCPWRWESLIALKNSPRYTACSKHTFGNVEGWLTCGAEYPVANYYWKNICKEKTILLTDIIKIIAVFSEVSPSNSGLLVLYENMSWIAHACTPNAELFFRQAQGSSVDGLSSLEIIIKAVNTIGEGCKITLNHFKNFEGGRSALALKLFQTKGHYCCDTECACYRPRSFDKTMGIRCDSIFSNHACSGILSPKVDAPNPEKSNLGLGMFMKSKKWECDKCKKSEKYESLHAKIMEVAQDLTTVCDQCCNISGSAGGFSKGQQSYLHLQNKLLSHLSDQHWMVWKAKLRILKNWTSYIGYGSVMLRSAVPHPFSSPQKGQRTCLMSIIKQKVDMYGSGIYANDIKTKTKVGVLELFAKRHGALSPKRGHLLLDAFYANLIVLLEDYKRELPLPQGPSNIKRGQVARENCKKVTSLRLLLEQAFESLKVTEGTTLATSSAKLLKTANECLEVLGKVCTKVEQRPSLIISYLNELLELYACQDHNFILSCVRKSQNKTDPFREGFTEDDFLDFEVDSINLGGVSSLTFGSAASGQSSEGVKKPSSSNSYNYGASSSGSYSFGFSEFGSPTFGASDIDSCSDIDEEDSPFVYSRSSKKANNTKSNGQGRKSSGGKKNEDDDWSSYFWLSSDEDNPADDDEFNLGFSSSPSSFGGDLFNDEELEDLAEWATLQFMMGKMKL